MTKFSFTFSSIQLRENSPYIFIYIYQLLYEAEYHLKNYGDRGGCYPPKTIPSLKQAKTCLPPLMLECKFIFDSACLSANLGYEGLYSSANILQIADVIRRVVFLLFMVCF